MNHNALSGEIDWLSFQIDDVMPSEKILRTQKIHDRLKGMLNRHVYSCSDYHSDVCWKMSYQPLLAAVYTAYSLHLPLCLSPDAIWITISQGIAQHMAIHGERLRGKFVTHEGKKVLLIRVHDWVPESPENPWDDAFRMWTDQIRLHVGEELYTTLLCQFSTTTDASRIANQIVMMDIFECYFKYHMTAICGIPRITLRGTEADWTKLASQVRALRIFDIDWWLDRLEPIIDQFALARRGQIDLAHWRQFCKLQEAYGGDVINGWVGYLFPYIKQFGQGPCNLKNPMFDGHDGISTHSAPSGLSEVPFIWEQASTCTKRMSAIGGLVGVTQDPLTKSLEPIAGWAVCDAKPIDELVFQIRSLVVKTEKHLMPVAELEHSQFVSSADEVEREIENVMPADLENLFRVYGSPFKMRFRGDLELTLQIPRRKGALDWGEEPEAEDLNSRGPLGRTWFAIGQTNAGHKLAINLDPNHPEPQSDNADTPSRISSLEAFEIDRPICVYSDETIGIPGRNPVICSNTTQLIRLLVAKMEDTGGFFWTDTHFVSLGDATEFTQINAMFPVGRPAEKRRNRKQK